MPISKEGDSIGIELKGMDSLLKKLDSISHIHVKDAIKAVEEDSIKAIKSGASFAPNASNYVGRCEVREGKNYYYVDIGLSNSDGNFEYWKELYFHNYGYKDKGLNFGDNGPYLDMHKQWFNQAVNAISPKLKSRIKAILEQEIAKGFR